MTVLKMVLKNKLTYQRLYTVDGSYIASVWGEVEEVREEPTGYFVALADGASCAGFFHNIESVEWVD